MALKWEHVTKTMFRLVDDPDVFDTGWRVMKVAHAPHKGKWLAHHRTHAPVDFNTEAEARAFVESTYILESSNGT